jgi:serine/threonine protein phosphatase 1
MPEMRELAIGDIHGCVRAFEGLLEIIQPTRSDTIVLLGDYVDRGPDSCGVLDMILELNRSCTVIALTGNHEKMMLQARSELHTIGEWVKQGGEATLNSYHRRGMGHGLNAVPKPHWQFLEEQTLDYWQTDRHIFVHASLDPKLDLDEQPEFLLFWQPFIDPTEHKSGKPIVCGHTSQKSGVPARFTGGICIDTWAHGGGWLTCFDTSAGKFIQTNERGEHRTLGLDALR